MSLFPELDRLSADELRVAFLDGEQAKQHGDEADLWLTEVATSLADSDEDEIAFLLACTPRADEPRLRAILVGLSSHNSIHAARHRSEIVAVGLALLHDIRPLVAMEAIDLLRCLGHADAHDAVLTLRGHSSPYVVGAVLRYLAQLFPLEAKPYLMDALASREPIVRQSAIDELDNLDCTESLPSIRRLLHDDDSYVRQTAQAAVTNLEELTTVVD